MKRFQQVAEQPLERYRYERKFLVDRMDAHQIRDLILRHPAMFVTPYPPRWVNNIYLDTPQLDNYADNVNGALDRCKVRLRWYGPLFNQPSPAVLEFKIKRGMVGKKIQYPLEPFTFDSGFSRHRLARYFSGCELSPQVKIMVRGQIPVLVNRYRRWYFATWDGRFRVTVDSEMAFFHVGLLENSFRYRHSEDRLKVVELKYQRVDDLLASRIASGFPFSVYKNSKYVYGMDCVYW